MWIGRLSLTLSLLAAAASAAAAPRIELYTIGPGDDLFSRFGHAALCVVDETIAGGGLCYNYGTSDFSRPIGLGWDVVRGRALFWVAVSDLPSMIAGFESESRTIYRQEIPLDDEGAWDLARRLAADAAPENRVYVYHHYLDNCSTRPRDLVDGAVNGALRRLDFAKGRTYRDYAVEGLGSFTWVLVPLSDFLMGRWVDREIDTFEAMFIPRVLREGVARALDVEPEIVFRRPSPEPQADVRGARRLTWVLVLVLVAGMAVATGAGAPRVAALGPILLTALGLVLVIAAAVSNLPELRGNELLAVFLPLDFLLLARDRRAAAAYGGFRLGGLALVGILAAAGILIQPLWPFWTLAVGIVALATYRAAVRARPTAPRAA